MLSGQSSNAVATTTTVTRLDPKYFQTHSSNQPQSNYNLDIIPIKQHLLNNKQQQQQQQQALLTSNSTSNTTSANNNNNIGGSVRINKQLIQPLATNNMHNNAHMQLQQQQINSLLPSKSTPSLASAYFPAASS
jgi:hypothetical protein